MPDKDIQLVETRYRFHVRRESGEIRSFLTKEEAIEFLGQCDQSYQCGCRWWEGDRVSSYEIPVGVNTTFRWYGKTDDR